MTAALAAITSRFGLELGDSTPLAILNQGRRRQRGSTSSARHRWSDRRRLCSGIARLGRVAGEAPGAAKPAE